jgi:hypothetical protein
VTAPAEIVAFAEEVTVTVADSFPAVAERVGAAGRRGDHCAKSVTVEVSEKRVTVWVST